MGIGERIKLVRKEVSLTQQAFAERLNLKRNTVGSYEVNVIEPSDRTISDICREFGVDEHWLRTGEGEMFAKPTAAGDKIMDFASSIARNDDDDFRKRFVAMLAGLDPADWELLEHMAEKLTKTKKEEASEKAPSEQE